MTVLEICAELDRLSVRREEAMFSPNCPPDLLGVSDRARELRRVLVERVKVCLELVTHLQYFMGVQLRASDEVPDPKMELIYFTSWTLLGMMGGEDSRRVVDRGFFQEAKQPR